MDVGYGPHTPLNCAYCPSIPIGINKSKMGGLTGRQATQKRECQMRNDR